MPVAVVVLKLRMACTADATNRTDLRPNTKSIRNLEIISIEIMIGNVRGVIWTRHADLMDFVE